jgi:hypothetical protein
MMTPLLEARLQRVVGRRQRLRLWCKLAGCWAGAAALGLGLVTLQRQTGWTSSLALPVVGLAGLAAAGWVAARHRRLQTDWRAVACEIEARHPELDGRLLTAVQQQVQPGGELDYLQERLVREAVLHSRQCDWTAVIPTSRIAIAQLAHLLALVLLGVVLWGLRPISGHGLLVKAPAPRAAITVTPGDTTLERGSSLVVLAKFEGALPASVDLIVGPAPESTNRVALVKSLADPMFGGSVPEVSSNLVYHVAYAGQRTRDFKVTVFEYPRLERADADLTFPDYTGQPPKHIADTRRVSAVEGSRLDLALQFNKPVVWARLVPKDKDRTPIPLLVGTNRPVATLQQFPLEASRSYELQLLDADGRTNKVPAQFVFAVLSNRPPELRLAAPRGDVQPSPLEEIAFEGTVWDDFGVPAYGLGYTLAGQETKFIELGRAVPARDKRTFQYLLRLEELSLQPDQLVAWFVWADDLGPDGQVRRTAGDLYFAEVRPFDEIFREGQGMAGQSQSQQQQSGEQSGQQGNQPGRLAELQKQIISATWKLQREHLGTRSPGAPGGKAAPSAPMQKRSSSLESSARRAASSAGFALGRTRWLHTLADRALQALSLPSLVGQTVAAEGPAAAPSTPGQAVRDSAPARTSPPKYEDDAAVVRDSQAQALEQAEAAKQRLEDPRTVALYEAATKAMEQALAKLKEAASSPALLPEALAAEQAAYQALLRARQRENEVSRAQQKPGQQGNSSRQQQMQKQLDQMDLTQSENRYETQRQAQAPQTPERREQLQVMNRLQELARRQQDLNERLKELQTALQETRTEQERQEIQRRLKRLQEEEQQMLADIDEVRQRMDRPENQSRMAEERKQLEQTREDVQRAAEAAGQGAAAQAVASGTRAQRQLQDLRDQMRKENASQFSEDMREMRAQARELASKQEDISKKLEGETPGGRKSLADSSDQKEMLAQLARQRERLTNLVERATQVSQQAETPEPLLSRQLYDTVRKFSQDTAQNVKESGDELLSQGRMPRGLYERLKDPAEPDGAKLLDVTSEMVRQDFLPQANAANRRARAGIDDLKRGVERAAESVLGDDTESLRLARQELDQLAKEVQQEAERAEGSASQINQPGRSQTAQAGARPGARGQQANNEPQQGEGQGPARQEGQTAQAGGQDQPGSEQTDGQQNGQGKGRQGQRSERQTASAQRGQQGGESGQQGEGQQGGQGQGQGQQGQGQPGQRPDQQTASAQRDQAESQANQPGEGQGQAQGQGQGQGRGRPGQASERQTASAQRDQQANELEPPNDGQQPGQAGANGRGQGGQPPQTAQANRQRGQLRDSGQRGGANSGAAGGNWDRIFDGDLGPWTGPITGESFAPWSDRLRDVEEMIELPQLRNEVAVARERARVLRQESKRDQKKPDWAVVQLQVVKPLVEVRDRIADELARRGSREALVPIDRDPVPNRYAELVRRYYEELGKDKP